MKQCCLIINLLLINRQGSIAGVFFIPSVVSDQYWIFKASANKERRQNDFFFQDMWSEFYIYSNFKQNPNLNDNREP